MFEKTKEKNQIKKDLNRRYEILDNLGREITNKSIELKNLEEKLARLKIEIGPYESLESIEKQRRELEKIVEEVGGYTELKEQVAKLKSEKDYLEDKKYDVKDIIFARYNLNRKKEVYHSVFIKKYERNIEIHYSYMNVIAFNEIGGIHKMFYVPNLGESVCPYDESADVELIEYISYAEICSALGVELKGYLTYEEVMNISNTFKSYMALDYNLTDTLNEIRNSRVNNANMHR